MQLCTNAKLFLDLVAASGQPKLWELTPPEARKKVIELTRMVFGGTWGSGDYHVYCPSFRADFRVFEPPSFQNFDKAPVV